MSVFTTIEENDLNEKDKYTKLKNILDDLLSKVNSIDDCKVNMFGSTRRCPSIRKNKAQIIALIEAYKTSVEKCTEPSYQCANKILPEINLKVYTLKAYIDAMCLNTTNCHITAVQDIETLLRVSERTRGGQRKLSHKQRLTKRRQLKQKSLRLKSLRLKSLRLKKHALDGTRRH